MSKSIKYGSILLILFSTCLIIYFKLPDEDKSKTLTSEEELKTGIENDLEDLGVYIDKYPKDEAALEKAMHLQHLLGELEEASNLGLRLIEINPNNYMYYHSMANIVSSMENWEEALQYRKRAYSLEPSIDMLYYLSTTYLAIDANYSLELLDNINLDLINEENESILEFRKTLRKYIQENSVENAFELAGFLHDKELVQNIFQKSIKPNTSSTDLRKIKEYIEYTYGA